MPIELTWRWSTTRAKTFTSISVSDKESLHYRALYIDKETQSETDQWGILEGNECFDQVLLLIVKYKQEEIKGHRIVGLLRIIHTLGFIYKLNGCCCSVSHTNQTFVFNKSDGSLHVQKDLYEEECRQRRQQIRDFFIKRAKRRHNSRWISIQSSFAKR